MRLTRGTVAAFKALPELLTVSAEPYRDFSQVRRVSLKFSNRVLNYSGRAVCRATQVVVAARLCILDCPHTWTAPPNKSKQGPALVASFCPPVYTFFQSPLRVQDGTDSPCRPVPLPECHKSTQDHSFLSGCDFRNLPTYLGPSRRGIFSRTPP